MSHLIACDINCSDDIDWYSAYLASLRDVGSWSHLETYVYFKPSSLTPYQSQNQSSA